jgi:hypothetical protein
MSMVIEPAVPPLIGRRQLALRLGCCTKHLSRMEKKGLLGPEGVRLGSCRRYDPREIEKWISSGSPTRAEWQRMRAEQGVSEAMPVARQENRGTSAEDESIAG